MKDRILRLCRRLDKFTLDEISTIAEDIDESVLELLLLTLVQEGKLIFRDNIYLYNKEQGGNKQRLPQFFQHHSKTDIDYIIKGFCIDIEVLKMIDLFGFSKHVMNNFYQYFRTIIYEQQKNELVKYFEKSPKIPQERIYMNAKVYLYLYFVAAFHIKPEVSRRSLAVGVARYSVLVPPHKYGVVVGCVLVNIAAGKEKARHIIINAAGCCEVVPRYSVVVVWGR